MAQRSTLSLDSVTRVREFSGPLANDLQKIMQFVNDLESKVETLQAAASSDTPAVPSALPDFLSLPVPDFRDDGAMDVAVQALALANSPPPPPGSSQIVFCTQATFPTLSAVPAGTIIAVTDYAHLIYWDGTTPIFLDGGNCFIALFDIDPGAGWHLLDGTANVPYLNANGTLGTYTVEDATTAFFLEAGLANSGPTAASAPTLAMSPYTPAGSVSAQTFSGTPAALTTAAVTATGAVNAITQIAGSATSYTPAGTVSAGSLAGTPATLTGTVSATGEPRKLVRRPYFRQ